MNQNMTIDPKNDTRNITDEFKGMSEDLIRLEMQKRRTGMISIVMNLTHDFNKSSCLRNHNAMSGREFIFVNRINDQNPDAPEGVKRYDKRGAVGTYNYSSTRHVRVDKYNALFQELRDDGYTIYAVDNTPGYDPKSIYSTDFPYKSAFVYGEEGLGLSDDMIAACDKMVYIPQRGTVRSLNIAVAHGIVSAFYSAQHEGVLEEES